MKEGKIAQQAKVLRPAWQPKFDPQDPPARRMEPSLASCPQALHTCYKHTHTEWMNEWMAWQEWISDVINNV